jgi:hypothetical protein
MITTLVFALLLGVPPTPPAPPLPQAPVTFVVGDQVAFDYLQADFIAFTVTRFEVSWDSGTFTTIGLPAPFVDAQTQVGADSYSVLPPFTQSTHSVAIRACNAVGCGPASLPFAFAYASSTNIPPGNVRRRLR